MDKRHIAGIACVIAAFSTPAFAQEPGKPDSIVLESTVGNVMTSTGGDYTTSAPGKQLAEGQSMMLSEGAKATVAYYYDNGERKCVEQYVGPNTYVIDDRCTRAAYMSNGSPGKSALIITGAALVGAAILESMDKVPPGPLSAGPRSN